MARTVSGRVRPYKGVLSPHLAWSKVLGAQGKQKVLLSQCPNQHTLLLTSPQLSMCGWRLRLGLPTSAQRHPAAFQNAKGYSESPPRAPPCLGGENKTKLKTGKSMSGGGGGSPAPAWGSVHLSGKGTVAAALGTPVACTDSLWNKAAHTCSTP